jgi:Leucine-rich repeat (LRR) protein
LLFSDCADKDRKIILEIPDAKFGAYLLENFDKNADGKISLYEAKAIKEIRCPGMEIESLDGIEKFVNLESLDCSNNRLDELELRYSKKLNKLVCTGNNVPLTIYISMSSPLRNPDIRKPAANESPQNIVTSGSPVDAAKITYDEDKTNIMIYFDE